MGTYEYKKYTIEQIRNYLKSQDSLADIFYNLSEENIDKANKEELEQPLLAIYNRMVAIRHDKDFTDEEQYDEIFALAKQMPYVNYYDPDTSYEEDMDAYLKAIHDHLKYNLRLIND